MRSRRAGLRDRVRYGIVCPGDHATAAIWAAAPTGGDCELAAIQPADASFDSYRALLADEAIDAVYLGYRAPLLLRYVVAALEAGVHVLCEEPPAASPNECEAMVHAARSHKTPPIVVCREALSPVHRAAAELARSGLLGDLRVFSAVACSSAASADVLADACVSQARQIFRDEPCEVLATTREELPATVSVALRFQGERLALFAYGFDPCASFCYDVVGSHGQLLVDSAPANNGHDELYATIAGVTRRHRFSRADALAAELAQFSARVLARDAQPNAREALANTRILAAIGRASRQGSGVRLRSLQRGRARMAFSGSDVPPQIVLRGRGMPGTRLGLLARPTAPN